jgi:hypothetical protein
VDHSLGWDCTWFHFVLLVVESLGWGCCYLSFFLLVDYILTGTYQQKVERLGRMVAPFMMMAVAKNILGLGVLNGNT